MTLVHRGMEYYIYAGQDASACPYPLYSSADYTVHCIQTPTATKLAIAQSSSKRTPDPRLALRASTSRLPSIPYTGTQLGGHRSKRQRIWWLYRELPDLPYVPLHSIPLASHPCVAPRLPVLGSDESSVRNHYASSWRTKRVHD